jgi:bifunctional DNA-binding transcriptional regulator/antitoxin component of YhaV-PrlF toxin-antitoxin module
MKLTEIHTSVDKQGCIMISRESLASSGLIPGDEVRVTLIVEQEETENGNPLLVISPRGAGAAMQLSGWLDDEKGELTLPNDLLEAAEISEVSDLEIICTAGAIVILESDILDNLPDELHDLFSELGINPETVREVMRKEGYFI